MKPLKLSDIKPNQVINTRTPEEFERICRLLDSEGVKPFLKDSFLFWENIYFVYGSNTCILVTKGKYSNVSDCNIKNYEIIDSTLIPSKKETVIERTTLEFTKVEDYEFLAYERIKTQNRFNAKDNILVEFKRFLEFDNIKLYTFETEETMNKWIKKEID